MPSRQRSRGSGYPHPFPRRRSRSGSEGLLSFISRSILGSGPRGRSDFGRRRGGYLRRRGGGRKHGRVRRYSSTPETRTSQGTPLPISAHGAIPTDPFGAHPTFLEQQQYLQQFLQQQQQQQQSQQQLPYLLPMVQDRRQSLFEDSMFSKFSELHDAAVQPQLPLPEVHAEDKKKPGRIKSEVLDTTVKPVQTTIQPVGTTSPTKVTKATTRAVVSKPTSPKKISKATSPAPEPPTELKSIPNGPTTDAKVIKGEEQSELVAEKTANPQAASTKSRPDEKNLDIAAASRSAPRRWPRPPNEPYYAEYPWDERPDHGYSWEGWMYKPRWRPESNRRMREKWKRRQSLASRKYGGRSGRKESACYDDYEDEDSASDSDNGSSSSEDSDGEDSPVPHCSFDQRRRKRRTRRQKSGKSHHRRRSFCECEQYEMPPERRSRATTKRARKLVSPDAEPPAEVFDIGNTQFPDYLEEVTEDYLAPGHPDYDATYGGPVVRTKRSIRPYTEQNGYGTEPVQTTRLACSRQGKAAREISPLPYFDYSPWGHAYPQPQNVQSMAFAGAGPYAQMTPGYGHSQYDQSVYQRYGVYAAPPYGTMPPAYTCPLCGCFDCPGDCVPYASMPRSELEERLRMDERQRLDFEERVRMQEKIDRLEERMWMQDGYSPRRTRRPGVLIEQTDPGEQYEDYAILADQFTNDKYASVNEYYDYTEADNALSDKEPTQSEAASARWDDGAKLERRQSLQGSTTQRSRRPGKRSEQFEKKPTPDRTATWRWDQSQCELTRRRTSSSRSSVGPRVRKSSKGERREESGEDMFEYDDKDDSDQDLADIAHSKPFAWTAPGSRMSAEKCEAFTWAAPPKAPAVAKGGKKVSYIGSAADELAEKGQTEGIDESESSSVSQKSGSKSSKASIVSTEALETFRHDSEKQLGLDKEYTKGTSDVSTQRFETAASLSKLESKLMAASAEPQAVKSQEHVEPTPTDKQEEEKTEESHPHEVEDPEAHTIAVSSYDKDMDQELQRVTLSTTNFFPETGLVFIIALLTLIWILIVFITSTVLHGDGTTERTTIATPQETLNWTWPDREVTPLPYFCHSVRCLREGDFLGSLMAGLQRPCDNFYRHVCDRWSYVIGQKGPQVPEAVSTDSILQEKWQGHLVTLVQNIGNGTGMKPVSDLFAACQDRPQANSRALDHARAIFQSWVIGRWPIESYDDGRRDDVWSLAGQLLRDLDLAVFVDLTIAADPTNTKQGMIAFSQADPMPILHKDDDHGLVRAAIGEVLSAFGIPSSAHADILAQEILSVFGIFYGILDLDTNTDDAKVSTMANLEPGFSSLATQALGPHAILDVSSRVLLLTTRFLEVHLPAALRKPSSPPRIFLNHLGFRALIRMAAFLPDNLSSLRQLSQLESTGIHEPPDVLRLCVHALERAVPMCLLKALAIPMARSGEATWQRRSIFDLQTVFLRAVPRISWIDDLSLHALSFRLRQWRFDALYPSDLAWETSPCAVTSPGNLAPLERFVDAFRQRKQAIQQELSSGPGWRVSPPLSAWPRLDLAALAVRVPQGVLNSSSWPSNDTLSTFQLTARVGARLYQAIVPLLYSGSVYEREMAVHITSDAERWIEARRECLMNDWQSVRRRLHVQYTPWRELNAQRWFRDWLLEQAVGLQLALYAFHELIHMGRIWKLDFRLGNLKHVSSTKLFFYYYALDHCERSRAPYQRRRLLMRLPPAPLRVNLPLRHVKAFAKEFKCADKDMIKADTPCRLFDQ